MCSRIFLRLTQQKTKIHLQNEVYFNRVRVTWCRLPGTLAGAVDSVTINLGNMLDTNWDLTENPTDRKYFFKAPIVASAPANEEIEYFSHPKEFHYTKKQGYDLLQWFEVECLVDGMPAAPSVAFPWLLELQFLVV